MTHFIYNFCILYIQKSKKDWIPLAWDKIRPMESDDSDGYDDTPPCDYQRPSQRVQNAIRIHSLP